MKFEALKASILKKYVGTIEKIEVMYSCDFQSMKRYLFKEFVENLPLEPKQRLIPREAVHGGRCDTFASSAEALMYFGTVYFGTKYFCTQYFGTEYFSTQYFGTEYFGTLYFGNCTFSTKYSGTYTFGTQYFGTQCNLAPLSLIQPGQLTS